ncbi:MAG TPA: flagellin [Phycisphaerae bacterium]|nr:flagellin [Phycisphaerae bacterium]
MSVINTNIPSITAVHRLAANQTDLRTRLERLSTGLRINRGRDDPAGLIASETLRNEMRGISQAIDNSQRAINVLSTAEGALNEISALLLDIRGLVNHAANSGAIGLEELKADQLQIDSIIESIDRIANTTQFGGAKLINGNFEYRTSGIAASAVSTLTVFAARVPEGSYQNITVQVTQSAQTAQVVFAAGSGLSENVTIQVAGRVGTEMLSFISGANGNDIMQAINAVTEQTGVSAIASSDGSVYINSQAYGKDALVSVKPIDGNFIVSTGSTASDYGQDATVLINGQSASASGLQASLRANGIDVHLALTADFGTRLGTTTFQITGGGATYQIGPEVNPSGQVSIGIPNVGSGNLGNAEVGYLYTLKDGGANSVRGGNFAAAEKILFQSIQQVAVLRGRLGGLQRNQLETNINSQRIALENVTAAESAIRDANIAAEVAALTRAQILVQSTTSILGVANQLPQSVLSLLG